jgi:hypothetical protein
MHENNKTKHNNNYKIHKKKLNQQPDDVEKIKAKKKKCFQYNLLH